MNVDEEDYGTDFEDGERNGWENDIGSPDGILKTEEGPVGPNTFWSGKLEWRPPRTFLPSLAKMLPLLPGGEQDIHRFFVSFRYRVHPLEPGEATTIGVVLTANVSLGHYAFWIDEHTPTGKWLNSDPASVSFYGNRGHILIGSHYGDGPGVSRKIDIDDIKALSFSKK
ncbi:hypothetical protein HX870_31710 [Pseudomonas gingeri]|uniref:hypothetical protein n=1 Tax=Pseudomonas gingeri TaxID=117681 RepID=UPI0015A1DD48|nr:hypothetical protein [Pseudomonas gingeri]NWD72184.1 hypothetical protein [Pseudomonas gingeri]